MTMLLKVGRIELHRADGGGVRVAVTDESGSMICTEHLITGDARVMAVTLLAHVDKAPNDKRMRWAWRIVRNLYLVLGADPSSEPAQEHLRNALTVLLLTISQVEEELEHGGRTIPSPDVLHNLRSVAVRLSRAVAALEEDDEDGAPPRAR